ncbi:hypothetical protein MPH_07164 [Macrophomina phaseolina MS6]|uniref:Uncharacterized protein n=1 Tax=Macrophomina phaseolina (strain MS6) TaxID=1126212 RepID=K2RZS6_MACPH|nr:hypothetical protein MPH_07164 [Macrophomina phaseolina MS6]
MTGLISHILAVTHDQVPKYGGDFRNGSSYFVAVTGALGVLDACFLFILALCQDDVPLRWNWSGKTKVVLLQRRWITKILTLPQHQQWKLPVHRIATLVALAAVLRGAAAAAYANYEYWDSDQSIDQNRGSDGTYYTPETWICYGATNQTVIEGEHPEYKWMCREAQGARYLTILTTIIAGITLILVLWRWRRSNLNKQYQPVASGRRDSDPLGQDVESGQGNGPEMRHTRLPSSGSIAPQEVVGREVYEMSADPIPEMEHRPVIRDSDELSIQGEPTQYFGHGYNPGQQHHARSYVSP